MGIIRHSFVALTVEVHRLMDDLECKGCTHVTDLKRFDGYTYSHSVNVAVLALAIGRELKLPDRKLESLTLCAVMHDIGKIALPIAIINKKKPLTAEEYQLIKTHSKKGGIYLKDSLCGDKEVWEGVTHHHEKFDGSGYPYGLKGEEIPLHSRIIAIADVFDAITSSRPYRKAMKPEIAINYILTSRAFDVEIIKAAFSILHFKW